MLSVHSDEYQIAYRKKWEDSLKGESPEAPEHERKDWDGEADRAWPKIWAKLSRHRALTSYDMACVLKRPQKETGQILRSLQRRRRIYSEKGCIVELTWHLAEPLDGRA